MIRKYLLLFLALALILTGCGRSTMAQESRMVMDTVVRIKIPLAPEVDVRSSIDKSFAKIEEIGRLMNKYDENSEVAFINNSRSTDKIKISPETAYVIKKALELNKISKGAFDITISPLVDLWDSYRKKKNEIPTKEEVAKALSRVGSKKIRLSGDNILRRTQDDAKIDLSGIAKGYAVDEAVRILREDGIENGLVNAGGDIYCLGNGPDNEGWRVGIKHPREAKLLGALVLKDKAVATSGDYEKFFIVDKDRYSHILDPRTGYPISDTPMSVTVVAPDCTTADGLATAISVMGPVEGLKLAEKLGSVEAVIISKDKEGLKIDMTSGLRDVYESL